MAFCLYAWLLQQCYNSVNVIVNAVRIVAEATTWKIIASLEPFVSPTKHFTASCNFHESLELKKRKEKQPCWLWKRAWIRLSASPFTVESPPPPGRFAMWVTHLWLKTLGSNLKLITQRKKIYIVHFKGKEAAGSYTGFILSQLLVIWSSWWIWP